MDLTQSTLEHLLARGERAKLSGHSRTIRRSFKDSQNSYWTLTLDDRVLLHERMRAAELAGAIRLEWSRQGGEERPLDGVVLVSLEKLSVHLGRRTVFELVDIAKALLDTWLGSELPIAALIDTWRSLRSVRGMGPESAKDFADAAKLVTELRSQPVEDRILRHVSVNLFDDSKRIEALQRHIDVLTAEYLQAPARQAEEVFAQLGLRKEPQPFMLSGAGEVMLRHNETCRIVRPYVGVAPSAIIGYTGSVVWVLTVENLTTFHVAATALGARTDGLIIYTGGMPSPAWCGAYKTILAALPQSSIVYHWGDIDEGGYRIAVVIRESCLGERQLLPWLMDSRTCCGRLVELQSSACVAMERSAYRLGWDAIVLSLGEANSLIGCEQESIPLRLPECGVV